MRYSTRRWLSLTLLVLGLGACQAIAGIEDRTLAADAEDPASPECESYCSAVMDACGGRNAVYSTEKHCLSVCKHLDPGDPIEPTGTNTVACRTRQAALAELEPDTSCRAAGPGGDGVCGTDCEGYCTLFQSVCTELDPYKTTESCLQACSGLTDQSSFDLGADHGGDTVECRLVHVTNSTLDPVGHCKHSPIILPEEWCVGAPDKPPTCQEYCQIELAACTGSLSQYESEQQCLDVCAALDPGTNADIKENTVGCRRYHSFSATLLADTHCPHSGPTGDGHCSNAAPEKPGDTSGNCESYCTLLEKACPTEFAALGSTADCMASCAELEQAPNESRYTVATAKQSTGHKCRVLHAARALATPSDPLDCAAAVGGDPCN